MQRTYEWHNDLTNTFGTSLYLLDLAKVRGNVAAFEKAFRSRYDRCVFTYSYKTNYIPQVCDTIRESGWLAEVVSDMEFELALRYGNQAGDIVVNGPIKTREHLRKFLHAGSLVHLDSIDEVMIAIDLAQASPDTTMKVGLRCNFACGDYISRFGIDAEDGQLRSAINGLLAVANIDLQGLHCHFPDRDLQSYKVRAENMVRLVGDLFESPPKYIDVGGGYFGGMSDDLKCQFDADIPSFDQYAVAITDVLKHAGLNVTTDLLLEPGSAIVANAMSFVSTIENIKVVRGKCFATVAGSKFNLGNFASRLNLPLSILSPATGEKTEQEDVDLVGYTCIEGDVLYRGYSGPIARGDIAVFDNAGSYSYVFKPPFIRPNVPILVHDSESGESPAVVSKRQETVDDILATFEEL